MRYELIAPIPTIAQKEGLREQIARDTEKFLANGGRIEVCGSDQVSMFSWDGVWLDVEAAAQRIGVSVAQLKNSVMNGVLASCPAPISYIRGGRRMWPDAAIDLWIYKYGKQRRRAFKDGERGSAA